MPSRVSPMSLFVGLSAGFASSLLVLSPVGGSTLAVPLTMVTPLPIIIGALGWGTFAASGGVLAGILLLLAVAPGLTVYFACFIAPPALIGSHLLGLVRPQAVMDPATGLTSSRQHWFPLGHMLVAMAATVALGSALVAVATGFDPSTISPERAHAIAAAYVDAMSEGQTASARADLIATFEPSIMLTMKILPFAFVATWTLIFAFNFAFAYWISLKSGNLLRPAENLTAIDIPRGVAIVAVVALGLATTGHIVGAVASAIAGASAGLLLIAGLAVVHALTRRLSFRLPLLVLVYLFLTLLSVPILILGALEPYLRLRERTVSGQ